MKTRPEKIPFRIQLRRLLLGLPALFLALGALVLAEQQRDRSGELLNDYEQAAAMAIKNKEWVKAEVYYRRLAWLNAPHLKTRYSLALVANGRGNPRQAAQMMTNLAPADAVGYGPAHCWLADRYVQDVSAGNPPTCSTETFEHHLLTTIDWKPNHTWAHLMLARLYQDQGRLKRERTLLRKSVDHFAKVVDTHPEYRLQLASLYRILGDTYLADSEADKVIEHYQEKLDTNPLDIESKLALASAQVFRRQFAEAVVNLSMDSTIANDKRIRESLAVTYIAWAQALDPKQEAFVGKRLELLQLALQIDPENPIVLNGFAQLTNLSGPVADRAREALKDVLATGRAPAVVHLTLGSIALQQDKVSEAEYHLNQAFELSPRMPEALNNLAWLLAHADPPQLERAIDLVNSAVSVQPGNAEMRETRGQVLFKMGRHQEALPDMLIAVREFPDRVRVHETLASIYEAVGDSGMVERHRRRASKIQEDTSSKAGIE